MKSLLKRLELVFERFTDATLKLYGSSLTFLLALIIVLIYLGSKKFYLQSFHDCIRDIILCITFLSYFIIQKSINKDTTAVHIKINELLAAHDKASNRLVNVEQKTEEEIRELSRYYEDLAQMAQNSANLQEAQSIENVLKKNSEKK